MAFAGTGTIWMNGSLVDWADAKIHIASHVIHYGSGVFEGRALLRHAEGLGLLPARRAHRACCNSAKIYRMEYPLDVGGLQRGGARDDPRQRVQGLLHPAARSTAATTRSASTRSRCPVDAAILVWEWGTYLGPEALEKGVDVRVSSWTRIAPNTFPTMAKSAANYANGAADQDGGDARRLHRGHRARRRTATSARAAAQNLFLVRDGVIYTPPLALVDPAGHHARLGHDASRATSATRCARRSLPREVLYIADELFFVGTAAEVTPIRSVDKIVGRHRQARPDHRGASRRASSTSSTARCPTRTAG